MLIDAAVDHRDAHSASTQPGVPRHRRVDRVGGVIQGRLHVPVERNIDHVRLIRESDHIPRAQGCRYRINQGKEYIYHYLDDTDEGADDTADEPEQPSAAAARLLGRAIVLHDYVDGSVWIR